MAATWKSAANGNWTAAASWLGNAVPLGSDAVTIGRTGNYTVVLDSAQTAGSLTFSAVGALFNETSTGSLNLNSGTGILAVNAGAVALNAANSLGGTVLNGGTLALGKAGALSTGYLEINGGTLLAQVDMTLAPTAPAPDAVTSDSELFLSGDFMIAAGHGVTFDIGPAHGWVLSEIDDGSSVTFGAPANDGTVIWHTANPEIDSVIDPSMAALYGTRVAGGTLEAGDDDFGYLLQNAAFTTVDEGASIDLAGHTMATLDGTDGSIRNGYVINDLAGGGRITSSTAAVLAAQGGDFGGVIAGAIRLIVAGPAAATLTLEGVNTYTGGTIVSGASAGLSIGGKGSIAGDVTIQFGASLYLDRIDNYTLNINLAAGGTGNTVNKNGSGIATINGHATGFDGRVFVNVGGLGITFGDALGTGKTTLGELNSGSGAAPGTELIGLDNFSFAGTLDLYRENATVSAATGKTFTLTHATASDGPAPTAEQIDYVGSAGHLGTVLWYGASTTLGTVDRSLDVAFGTLKAGDSAFATSLGDWLGGTIIDAGATLDLNGTSGRLLELRGGGTLTSVAGGGSVTLDNLGVFTGRIVGNLGVTFANDGDLVGTSDYAGITDVGTHHGANDGVFTINADILDDVGGQFANGGLFRRDSPGAVEVEPSFINGRFGVIDVTKGAIVFNGGFANAGMVHGVLVRAGSVYTITANEAGQSTWFGGTGDNALKVTALPTYFEGGGGVDTIEVAKSMTFRSTTLSGVEIVKVDNGFTANLAALSTGESIQLLSRLGGKAVVVGTQGTDKIAGGAGTDTINGGLGRDVISGGGGNDRFVFSTKIGAGNVDTISDFSRYHDIIQLDNAVMSGLGHATGRLSNAAFYAHAGAAFGHDASDRIVLDTSSGKLYYDSNGSHSGGATQIAQLTAHMTLDAGSFEII